jgi:hypothetical protein
MLSVSYAVPFMLSVSYAVPFILFIYAILCHMQDLYGECHIQALCAECHCVQCPYAYCRGA